MGGKHKLAQRTKNNTRPSSSGRSAELLGSTLPHFVGFSTVKESSGFPLADDIDTLIDTNFQLVFKKMNKKDSTTKLKALQEFTDLVKAADVEAIKAVLPFWPRLYSALAIDSEHKVREATQLAHHQVVLKAKRNLAPYLKQLAGTWFISQYDTYAPSASAASRAFQDSFPQNKEQEAIIFCQEEILNYICDNLTLETPQTLSNTKTTTEEAEAKYQRVVVSSLNSYALYLTQLPSDQIEKQSTLNMKIIKNPKFWKLGKSKIPPIRSAWFAVLTMLCQKTPLLAGKECARIVGSVFSNLDENEPTVLPAVWEAALSILSFIDEWWKHVNVDKVILPKLYNVLKEGGNGNAAVIFPNLLPVLSHLPDVIDVNGFYPTFFENMRMGLKTKTVLGSRSESQAISIAFIECLQYIIMQHQTNIALCEKLIKTQLFPLLEWSFNDTQACYKILYNQLAKLIQFWDRNTEQYEKYSAYFWHNLESLFLGLLLNLTQSCEVVPSQLATRQIELVASLKHLTKNKRLLKVSFASEQNQASKENITATFSDSYWVALNLLVYKTCEAYVKIINEKRSKELIEYFVSLIHNFATDSFFHQFNVEKGLSFCTIYREVLLNWLNDDVLCSKAIVDLIFLLFKYFSEEEKLEILNGFCKAKEECLSWCVSHALSHPSCEDPVVLQWLNNDTVHQFLISIAEKEISDTSTPELHLILKQAFTEKADNDLIITKEAVLRITEILTRPLLDPSNYPSTLDACTSFVSYISTILYTPHFKLLYGDDVLLALFTLSNSIVSEEILSSDTYWEINTAWPDVVSTLSEETAFVDFKKVAEKCSEIVWKSNTFKSVDLICDFLNIVHKNSPLWLKDILVIFLKHDCIDKWRDEIWFMCEKSKYIRGSLYIPLDNVRSITITEVEIEEYFEWMVLVVRVLVRPLRDDTKQLFNHLIDLLQHDGETLVYDLFATFSLGKIFINNYKSIKTHQSVKGITIGYKDNLSTLCTNVSIDFLHFVENLLLKKQKGDNWLWTNCLYDFYALSNPRCLSSIYTDLVSQLSATPNKSNLLHLTQTWSKHITYDQLWENPEPFEAIIMLRYIIEQPELDVPIAEAFALVDRIKRENQNDFVYNGNLTWEKTELVIEIIRLFSAILKYKSKCVLHHRWDLILISFVTWSENIAKSLNDHIQTKSLVLALSDLFVSIKKYIKESDNVSITNEWKDVFAQDVHSRLIEIAFYYADIYQKNTQLQFSDMLFLQDFGKMLTNLEEPYIFSKTASIKWIKLLLQACSLLTHPIMTLQLWGYHMLIKLIPGVVKIDAEAVATNTPHEKGLVIEQFKTRLTEIQEIVQSMLLEFKLGEDSCRVEPFTDSYTYTFAYLLLWDVILSLCEQSSTELRYQYSDWLKKEDFVGYLLMNLFKLIPLEMNKKSKPLTEWFTTRNTSDFAEAPTSEVIERLVCSTYSFALSQVPVLVRQWWCNQDSRVAQLVERITATYVSSHLCNQELADLTKHVHKFKNMTIKTHPVVREVIAIYTVDEVQMELVITLPSNYPLVGPEVHCHKQMLGSSHRQWLMQLKMCVLHQEGRIWDGLLLWNNNLDKRFDGVEECYICFAVIHQGTYQIPKLSCQTCKKKFHSACLYKWFSTSNKSSCPVCRNLF